MFGQIRSGSMISVQVLLGAIATSNQLLLFIHQKMQPNWAFTLTILAYILKAITSSLQHKISKILNFLFNLSFYSWISCVFICLCKVLVLPWLFNIFPHKLHLAIFKFRSYKKCFQAWLFLYRLISSKCTSSWSYNIIASNSCNWWKIAIILGAYRRFDAYFASVEINFWCFLDGFWPHTCSVCIWIYLSFCSTKSASRLDFFGWDRHWRLHNTHHTHHNTPAKYIVSIFISRNFQGMRFILCFSWATKLFGQMMMSVMTL